MLPKELDELKMKLEEEKSSDSKKRKLLRAINRLEVALSIWTLDQEDVCEDAADIDLRFKYKPSKTVCAACGKPL